MDVVAVKMGWSQLLLVGRSRRKVKYAWDEKVCFVNCGAKLQNLLVCVSDHDEREVLLWVQS